MSRQQHFLTTWHKAIETQQLETLAELVAESAQLSSPAYWKPKTGRAVVMQVIRGVLACVEDFRYTREWIDGDELILLFEATVDEKSLRGIDRIRLNDDGHLVELEVFVRPANGLKALAARMQEFLSS